MIFSMEKKRVVVDQDITRFLNRAEVVSFRSFPRSVVPFFHCSRLSLPNFFRFFVKIEKFLQKWIPHPFLRGACPQKHVRFFPKKIFVVRRRKYFSKSRQAKHLKFFSQNRKIPTYLNSRPQNRGVGVGHFGSG